MNEVLKGEKKVKTKKKEGYVIGYNRKIRVNFKIPYGYAEDDSDIEGDRKYYDKGYSTISVYLLRGSAVDKISEICTSRTFDKNGKIILNKNQEVPKIEEIKYDSRQIYHAISEDEEVYTTQISKEYLYLVIVDDEENNIRQKEVEAFLKINVS